MKMRDRRKDEATRLKHRETFELSVKDLIMPIFVKEGLTSRHEIKSMPGIYQFSLDEVANQAKEIYDLGIPSIILFGIPEHKDEIGSSSYDEKGVVQEAIRKIKKEVRSLTVIADVCMCEYTSHGHCGVLTNSPQSIVDSPQKKNKNYGLWTIDYGLIDNDKTIEVLAKIALSYAKAGVDMVAPSAMMDHQVGAIKKALVENGYPQAGIMSYSAKYASNFYGPFRELAESPPQFGDRKTYQMDYYNSDEAVLEAKLDIEEGADIIMVKPALGYQDIICRVKKELDFPLACYSVSGEYSMIKAASAKGCLDEKKTVHEMLIGFKRAGADFIITYYAAEVAKWIKDSP